MWGIRFPETQRQAIDNYAVIHRLTRAEAVRRLVEMGLQAAQKHPA